MTDAQARRLWDAAAQVRPPGRIVEIGSFHGRSTIIVALAAQEGVEVVAVDPHGGGDRGPNEYVPDAALGERDHRIFHANLERAGVESRVQHVRRRSLDAFAQIAGPVDMLYIDGAHRYRFAKADIEHWGARVRPGGSVLIHDCYNALGVMLAQIRLLFFSRECGYVGRSGSLAEYRRERLLGAARAANTVRQMAGIPYFVRNSVVKVLIVARLRPLARLLGERRHWPY